MRKQLFIIAALTALILCAVACAGCTGTDDGSVVYRTDLIGNEGYIEVVVNEESGDVYSRTLDARKNVLTELVLPIDHGPYNNPVFLDLGRLGSAQYTDEIMLLRFNGTTFTLYPV